MYKLILDADELSYATKQMTFHFGKIMRNEQYLQ